MKEKINKESIGVIFGGRSVEHDISIITGVQVLNALDRENYNIIPIYISKDNIWYTGESLFDIATFSNFEFESKLKVIDLSYKNKTLYEIKGKKEKRITRLDFVYLCLHGGSGECGGIQGYLDICDIPYSSCGVLGSSICMSKHITKLICKTQNIKITKHVFLNKKDKDGGFKSIREKIKSLKYPLIVKPNSLGSSIGITYCEDEEKLKNGISFAFMFDDEIIVEEVVKNLRELNISLIGNKYECEVSDIEEVRLNNKFLTFENKYLEGTQKEDNTNEREIPAKLDKIVADKIILYAKKIYSVLGLKGCIRVDFLLDDKENEIYLNEINTIPGSMACYLWKEKKYSFRMLLDKMKDYALIEKQNLDKRILNFNSSVLRQFRNNKRFNKSRQKY